MGRRMLCQWLVTACVICIAAGAVFAGDARSGAAGRNGAGSDREFPIGVCLLESPAPKLSPQLHEIGIAPGETQMLLLH